MTQTPEILELSVDDALVALAASNLPKPIRHHWRSSALAIARGFDQPITVIPARYSAVRARMASLHHVPLNWTPKTLANHKSNFKSCLLWFQKEKDVLPHGVPLSPTWERLRSRLTDPSSRYRLMPVMRFCSGIGVEPELVCEAVFDRYENHRSQTTTRGSNATTRRILARLWNEARRTVEGWPAVTLVQPPVKAKEGPAWEEFPEGLRVDIDRNLESFKEIHYDNAGRLRRPCKPSTLTTRRRELVAAARIAVKVGIPIESLTSLRVLLDPTIVEKILEGYWPEGMKIPPTYAINLIRQFVSIAQRIGDFDAGALERLAKLRFRLEEFREEGMTPKNLALIRQVLTEGVWERVSDLPKLLMQQARAQRHAPIRAALTAQIAVAVAIETVAPIRLANLAAIQLEENLTKPGGPDSNYWLSFRKYDVKNGMPLQFKLDAEVTAIINEYVHDFRPALMRNSNADFLFPGEGGKHKEKISFSTQIVDRIEDLTGLRITIHQFRHAAGVLILKHYPGNYELVRRILGHKSSETTKKFYLSLDTTQASDILADIVHKRLTPQQPGV